ncbi:peptidase S14 [Chromobacterium sp. Panama]|uniref:ATP-dependent Clp protease proteolytic subunit n=1 Tax=Chromobacterium sp. Panama TaxID=2161826 RepID=UPI000D2FA670|nr:ATP-dependent Clp protease proteolytic subunit [Chromobacterium sp. Panama]PTU65943.1 peptidase S14 [Chromobacterium sp. Panama]
MLKKIGILAFLLIGTAASADNTVRHAKIFYSGDMKISSVSELTKAIDDANANDHVDRINIYINSYGGDMDSGLMAAAAIRSSKKTVTTVAMTTVGSSATLMLCAAKDRRALREASIYLHPSFIEYKGELRPDTLKQLVKENERFNNVFKTAYKKCTSLDSQKINDILYSESNKVTFTPQEAIKVGLISAIDEKIIDTPETYYITAD